MYIYREISSISVIVVETLCLQLNCLITINFPLLPYLVISFGYLACFT